MAGLAVLDATVLVATGPKLPVDVLGAPPDNVIVRPWVAQAAVLPHLELVVSHAGSGTMLGALAEGLPQLLLPRGVDQFVNADAVLAAGAGERLLPEELTASAVAASARRLLAEPTFRASARRVADEIAAMPGPDEIADHLPDILAQLTA